MFLRKLVTIVNDGLPIEAAAGQEASCCVAGASRRVRTPKNRPPMRFGSMCGPPGLKQDDIEHELLELGVASIVRKPADTEDILRHIPDASA
jgi:hypothetical protein